MRHELWGQSGSKVACTAYDDPTATPPPPPTNQFARQVERGQFEAEGVGVRPDTEETAYFRESGGGRGGIIQYIYICICIHIYQRATAQGTSREP